MLAHIPDNSLAVAAKTIHDITEDDPIPRGATVHVEDWIECDGLFVVEWEQRIYLATEDELRI